jgi:predicted nucleic acid-binding protein
MVVDASVWVAASDPHDPLRRVAVSVFKSAAESGAVLRGPATLVVEVACALARKAGHPGVGVRAYEELMDHAGLHLDPVDGSLIEAAIRLGAGLGLRSGDAFSAAVARRHEVPLIAWDRELVERAGAVTPEAWLGSASAFPPE